MSFEWQDKYLMDTLLKQFKTIYSYSNDPDGLSRDETLSELNRLISNFNDRIINEIQFISEMESNIKKLIKQVVFVLLGIVLVVEVGMVVMVGLFL